jgi:hypothetical protein
MLYESGPKVIAAVGFAGVPEQLSGGKVERKVSYWVILIDFYQLIQSSLDMRIDNAY